jgi:hypothetical protein
MPTRHLGGLSNTTQVLQALVNFYSRADIEQVLNEKKVFILH